MEQAGVDDVELAERCGTDPDVVAEWREGTTEPGKTQFRRLVARLRRPSAIYFLREPPEPDPVLTQFRHRPGERGSRDLLDVELRAIRSAERVQKVSRWIREKGERPSTDLPLLRGMSPNEGANRAREFLQWDLALQVGAPSSSEIARALRARMEDKGILVLQLPMSEDGARGFSLYDERAPLLAANTAYITEARVFTFLHELAHLLRGRSWICGHVPDSKVEHWCENFAGSFLMPRKEFVEFLTARFGTQAISSINDVTTIARRFHVSLRATAVMLDRVGRAVDGLYEAIDLAADYKRGPGFSRDNSAAAVRLREWGAGYARLLLDAEEQGLLGRTDLLEYFNVPTTQLQEIRSRVEAGVTDSAE
jgi:Zn-dependent peptidase ImmA (M78 family)